MWNCGCSGSRGEPLGPGRALDPWRVPSTPSNLGCTGLPPTLWEGGFPGPPRLSTDFSISDNLTDETATASQDGEGSLHCRLASFSLRLFNTPPCQIELLVSSLITKSF